MNHTLGLSDLVESCDVNTLHLWMETKGVDTDCLRAQLLMLHTWWGWGGIWSYGYGAAGTGVSVST